MKNRNSGKLFILMGDQKEKEMHWLYVFSTKLLGYYSGNIKTENINHYQ